MIIVALNFFNPR